MDGKSKPKLRILHINEKSLWIFLTYKNYSRGVFKLHFKRTFSFAVMIFLPHSNLTCLINGGIKRLKSRVNQWNHSLIHDLTVTQIEPKSALLKYFSKYWNVLFTSSNGRALDSAIPVRMVLDIVVGSVPVKPRVLISRNKTYEGRMFFAARNAGDGTTWDGPPNTSQPRNICLFDLSSCELNRFIIFSASFKEVHGALFE